MAKLLYLSKRARPYIQLAVSFLFTISRGPDTDDYKKMVRVMKYIQGTIGLPLILSIHKSGNIKRYVDASFEIHKDMRNHTGGLMTTRTGGAYVQYSKQKMNTKNSAEAKLVGVDDVANQFICTQYFLKKQGSMIHDNIIYQDNQSKIRLKKNGKQSIRKRTRHINTRYYFITDRIMKQEESMEFFSQRNYRDLNSVDSETLFLVSMKMTFQPTTHLEEIYLKNEN